MLLLNALQRILMEEKPLLVVYVQASAPFFGALPIKLPEQWEYAWLNAYPDLLLLKWGFFRKRQKEIRLAAITSFRLAHLDKFPYKLSLSEWQTTLCFKDDGKAVCLEVIPTKNSLIEFIELINFLKKKIPNKEKKSEQA